MGSPAQAADLWPASGTSRPSATRWTSTRPTSSANSSASLGLPATVETHPDLWDLPARFNTALFPVAAHGERELKLDLLDQSFHVLGPARAAHLAVRVPGRQLLPKWHKKVFGKCSELPASKQGSVFWSVRDGDRPRRRHELTFRAEDRRWPVARLRLPARRVRVRRPGRGGAGHA